MNFSNKTISIKSLLWAFIFGSSFNIHIALCQKLDFRIDKLSEKVINMQISANGEFAAFEDEDHNILLQNLLKNKTVGFLPKIQSGAMYQMVFSDDNHYFLSFDSNFIKIYDLIESKIIIKEKVSRYFYSPLRIDKENINEQFDNATKYYLNLKEKDNKVSLLSRNSLNITISNEGIVDIHYPSRFIRFSITSTLPNINKEFNISKFVYSDSTTEFKGVQILEQPWLPSESSNINLSRAEFSPKSKYCLVQKYIKATSQSKEIVWSEVWDMQSKVIVYRTSIPIRNVQILSDDGKSYLSKEESNGFISFHLKYFDNSKSDLIGTVKDNGNFLSYDFVEDNNSIYLGQIPYEMAEDQEVIATTFAKALGFEDEIEVSKNPKESKYILMLSKNTNSSFPLLNFFVNKVQFINSTKTLYFLKENGTVSRFNTLLEHEQSINIPLQKPIKYINWIDRDSLIIANDESLRIINLRKAKQIFFYPFEKSKFIDYSPINNKLLTSNGLSIRVHNFNNGTDSTIYLSNPIQALNWVDSKNDCFLVNYQLGKNSYKTELINLKTNLVLNLSFNSKGQFAYRPSEENDNSNFTERNESQLVSDFKIVDFFSNDSIFVITSGERFNESDILNSLLELDLNELLENENSDSSGILLAEKLISQKTLGPGEVRVWQKDGKKSKKITYLGSNGEYLISFISRNGRYLFINSSNFQEIDIYDLMTNSKIGIIKYMNRNLDSMSENKSFKISNINVTDDLKFLVYGDNDNLTHIERLYMNTEKDTISQFESEEIIKFKIAYDLKVINEDFSRNLGSKLVSSSFLDTTNFIALGLADGNVELIDVSNDRSYIGTLNIGSLENDFIVEIPNSYLSGKDALSYLTLLDEGIRRPFHIFDKFYNRPDLVSYWFKLKLLSSNDTKEEFIDDDFLELINAKFYHAEKEGVILLDTVTFTKRDYLKSPKLSEVKISIENKNDLLSSQFTSKDFIDVDLEIASATTPHINLFVLNNGVSIFGSEGFLVENLDSSNLIKKVKIPLVEGENSIEIFSSSISGLQSNSDFLFITKTSKSPKPNLYFIGIACDDYKEEAAPHLQFPVKDVTDVKHIFESNNDLFENVYSFTLFNKDVTIANIKQIKSQLEQANVNDYAVLYISGHGASINDKFYYLTSNSFSNRDLIGSLNFDTIEGLLDKIKPLKKTILIDACHSGDASYENSDDFTKKTILRHQEYFVNSSINSGANIISASNGLAFEPLKSPKINNGFFTHVFKIGLEDSKADLDNDGKIMFSELSRFVRLKVPSYSRQIPAVRHLNRQFDFRIY